MIKILILDDSDRKISNIKKVLVDGCGIDEANIKIAKSNASGRKAVTKECFDLVLLDLVLPAFDDEEPEKEGGLSFVREIMSAGASVKMPTQIIGLTEKEDAYAREKEEFQTLLFSVIQCRQSDSEWINQLKQAVNYSVRCKEAILSRLEKKNRFDVAVICALPEEFKQMIEAFGGDVKWENVNVDEDVPFIFKSCIITTANNHEIRVVSSMVGRPGVVPTSVLTTLMYMLFHVDFVFMTGFSAGFPSKYLQLGDIMIASSIQDYASGKLVDVDGNIKLLKEIHQIETATELSVAMQELLLDNNTQPEIMGKIRNKNLLVNDRDSYQAIMSATCCGPYVVTSEEAVNDLMSNDRKLEGLDMEGFGLYLTAKILSKKKQKGAMWIKGVGDFANPQKADGYHKTCSFGSAALLYRFIKEKL